MEQKSNTNPQPTITLQDILKVTQMLSELTHLSRWSELITETGNFPQLGKQALNCAIAFFWGNEISKSGIDVDFSKFPKLALKRGFFKTFLGDIQEENLACILNQAGISEEKFQEIVFKKIENNFSPNFSLHLQVDTNSLEAHIYKASSKVATMLEFRRIGKTIDERDYKSKESQIQKSLEDYSNLPCYEQIMSAKYQEIFRNFLKLQNRIRWSRHPKSVSCSVLGHLFDTAVFAYLMSIEANSGNENLATQYFFMGIFHDFPEAWTGDMPSPVKDSIPGLRKATEAFENQVMEKYVYSNLSPDMAQALRAVMLEDEDNADLKAFLKKADSLAAYVECCRNFLAGSRHYYYLEVIKDDFYRRKNLPTTFCQLMEKLYSLCLHI